ncbi:MAG TPA: kynureninase [Aliidongia sp.]|nr:kynureninase [Aliidongia sp.]
MLDRAAFEAFDRADALRPFRDRFALPPGIIYMDGNSLGALPRSVPARIAHLVAEEWGQDLIRSWNKHGWIELQHRIGDKIGRLIGAKPGETVVADSTSVNLYKLLGAALSLRPERRIILSEAGNFPTDLYIAEGLAALSGRHALRLAEPEALEAAIDESVAVLMLTHVDYRTGRMHDLERITRLAHRAGVVVLWDLSHSAGAVPVDLNGAEADFAVGCGYKYLNGGPGAPAYLFIAERWQQQVTVPLTGWLGHADPFAFEPSYRPAEGIARAVTGTPPILSLAALEMGVDIALDAPVDAVRAKSIRQFELFAALVEQELPEAGFEIATPRDPAARGSQICLAHRYAWPIMQALIGRGVIGDFRAPDIMRFGFTPLYLGFAEIWDAVAIFKDIMTSRSWDRPEHHASAWVT